MRTLLTEVFVALLILGLHTGLSVSSGEQVLVPYALSGVAATCILLLHLNKSTKGPARSLGLLAVVVLGMSVIAGFKNGGWAQPVISTMLFIYSVIIAYAAALGISEIGIHRARRMLLIWIFVLIIGCLLELYGGLRPISDAFRAATNGWRPIYDADTRDAENYGELRPNFFASEPSIVGIMSGYAVLFWFLSHARLNSRRLLIAIALSAVLFYLVRSPTILVCLAAQMMFFFAEFAVGRKVPRGRTILMGAGVFLSIIFVPPIVSSLSSYGRTGSFFIRELIPPVIAAEVLKSEPLFGVGLGGSQSLMPHIINSYSSSGGFARLPQFYEGVMTGATRAKHLTSNQLWEYWTCFGLLGGLIVGAAVWRMLGRMWIPNRLLVISTGAMMMTMLGGINTPIGWVGMFSAAVLYRDHLAARTRLRAVKEAAIRTPVGRAIGGNSPPQPV